MARFGYTDGSFVTVHGLSWWAQCDALKRGLCVQQRSYWEAVANHQDCRGSTRTALRAVVARWRDVLTVGTT